MPDIIKVRMKFIKDIEKKIKYLKESRRRAGRILYHILFNINRIIKSIISSDYRRYLFSVIYYRNHFHQVSHLTEEDRYPDLFKVCGNYFANDPAVKILSFGCSTGEEVNTLGTYMPEASITGVEINNWCLSECSRKYKNNKFRFIHSLSADFKKLTGFNAIFCLAVFQHDKNRHRENNEISDEYPFRKFEDQLIDLDKKLIKGGLLFIDNSDFRFLDTVVSEKYSVLEVEGNSVTRDRPLYDKNNRKISEVTEIPRVFVKRI